MMSAPGSRQFAPSVVAAGVVCPYHAWVYNLDGTLRAAPFVRFDAACPKDRFSLVPVQLDTWGGFVFVNLAAEPASPVAGQIGPPVQRLARYPLVDLRRGTQIVYDVKANWKIVMENYNECYHCGPVHPELCALVPAFRERGGAGLDWDDGIPHRPGAWTFTLGVNNLFDEKPPICFSCDLNSLDGTLYPIAGQFWYARVIFEM